MNKTLLSALCLASALCGLHAQQSTPTSQLLKPMESLSIDTAASGKTAAKEASAQQKAPEFRTDADKRAKGPTEITCSKEASFEDKSRKAVFTGEVRVKDPQFTMTADKLTAFIRQETIASGTTSAPKKTSGGNVPGMGGLERAIAEGHVVIVQEKPGENGGEATRYVAKAGRAEFQSSTGDMVLYDWPQVQQGINLHVATEQSTVMTINRDGRMKTNGRSRTLIQDKPDDSMTKK
jgi:lipopolysaccharide export system protein LptA